MRATTHRFTRTALAAATALSLAAAAIQPAAAEDNPQNPGTTPISSDVTVTVEKTRDDGTTYQEDVPLPGYTQASSALGSAEIQKWYNGSPDWAQVLLGALFVALSLDLVGTLLGPVRSTIFNVIRDSNLPIPVPPRP
ncbi:hypothetical protein ACFSSC_03540 [Corynebacterium mendelii]|uniref:Or membrane protein n=1 Tax=Corynebacterium mendelii TaxID=2765362 RepID=A0A939IWY8_9CORY|nr:hypothetical protein [Corynebacterium mendelii]MBN9643523.1 hypothetical protein [Corynebacterium mendelii]